MLRFACKGCGQKMKVPEEYAGKKVRCQGCKEPARVPTSKSASSSVAKATAAVASRPKQTPTDLDDLDSLHSGSFSLSDLAEMEARAPAAIVTRDSEEIPEGQMQCESCGSLCSQNAKICIDCGYQFAAGKKLTTKKRVASFDGGARSAGSFGQISWGTFLAGIGCVCIGLGVMVFDYDPGNEDSRSAMQRFLSFLYAYGGRWIAGGLLLVVGGLAAWWGWRGKDR